MKKSIESRMKEANVTIGLMHCPHYQELKLTATVHRNSAGRLYYKCHRTGQFDNKNAGFQEFMLREARLFTPDQFDAYSAGKFNSMEEFEQFKESSKQPEIVQEEEEKDSGWSTVI